MVKDHSRRSIISLTGSIGIYTLAGCNRLAEDQAGKDLENNTSNENETEASIDENKEQSSDENEREKSSFQAIYQDWLNSGSFSSSEVNELANKLERPISKNTREGYQEAIRIAERENTKSGIIDSHKLTARAIFKIITNNAANPDYFSKLDIIYYTNAIYPVARHFFDGDEITNLKYDDHYTLYSNTRINEELYSADSPQNFYESDIPNIPVKDRIYHKNIEDLSKYEKIIDGAFDQNYNREKFSSSPPPAAVRGQSEEITKVAEKGIMSQLKAYSGNLFLSDFVDVPYNFTYRSNIPVVPWNLNSHNKLISSLESQSSDLWKSAVKKINNTDFTGYTAVEVQDNRVQLRDVSDWKANYPGKDPEYEYRDPDWECDLPGKAQHLYSISMENGEDFVVVLTNSLDRVAIHAGSGDKAWEYSRDKRWRLPYVFNNIFLERTTNALERIDPPSGQVIWSKKLDTKENITLQVIETTSDAIYLNSSNSLFSIDRDSGDINWKKPISSVESITSTNNKIYVISTEGSSLNMALYCIVKSSGTTDWNLTDSYIGPMKLIENNLYVSDGGKGELHMLSTPVEQPELTAQSKSINWTYQSKPGLGGVGSIFSYKSNKDSIIVKTSNLVALNKETGEKIWSTDATLGEAIKTNSGIFIGGYQDRVDGDIYYAAMYDPSSGRQKWQTDHYGITDVTEFKNRIYMREQTKISGLNSDTGEEEWSYVPQKLSGIAQFTVIGDYLVSIEEDLVTGFNINNK